MEFVIHKRVVKSESGTESFFLAEGSELLDIQVQNHILVLWYLRSNSENQKMFILDKYETDKPIEDDSFKIKRHFLKTVQLDGGAYVLHIFERLIS